MKKLIYLLATAILAVSIVSCEKTPVEKTGMSPDEQMAYIDAAGDEALSQIEPADFQKLADIVNAATTINPDEISFDKSSQTKLILLVTKLLKTKGIVIDPSNISGTFTLNGNTLSYDTGNTGNELKLVLKSGSNTYSFVFDLSAGSREVKVGSYFLDLEGFKKTFDIYFVIPPDLNFNLYCNGAIYMGADLDVKTSNMPSDWSSLTLDKINCSASGTVFINGKNSYRAEINKLGVANSEGSFDGTLYGNKGAFLFSGTAYAKLIENGYLDYLIDFDNAKAYGNLINKLNSKKNAQNGTDCYFVGKDEIQLTMNGNTVTFSDGTVMNSSEVFVEKNFPKTSKSLLTKLEELLEMFGLDW